MKLTPEHIDQLYKFTRAHFVEWYDLQTELVDHLANDIEAIWEKEPDLSFEQAKNIAFKKFGVFGFHDVIVKKNNAVNKHYWRMVWNILKTFFKPPKIMLTIAGALLLFVVLEIIRPNALLISIIFWILFSIPAVYYFKYNSIVKKRFKKTKQKWLSEEAVKQSFLLFLLSMQIFFQIFIRFNRYTKIVFNSVELFLIAFCISLTAIFIYIIVKIIPEKMEEETARMYPEYKVYLRA